MNPNEEEQKKKKKSGIDYANEGINKSRDAYNAYKKVQGVVRFARGAQAAAEGAEAATAAASSVEIWGPILVIILLILLIVGVVIIIFGGGAQAGAAPTCTGITSSAQTVSSSAPVSLSENGCTGAPTYTWTSTDNNGSFSASNSASTTFTPSASDPNGTIITITMMVCSSQNSCNQYTTALTISTGLCTDIPGQFCSDIQCDQESPPATQGSGTCLTPNTKHCCGSTTFTCPAGNYAACLSGQFRITVVGASNAMLKKIYDVYALAFTSHPRYLALFKSRTPTFTFVNYYNQNGAFAITSGNGDVLFFLGFVNQASAAFQSFVLVHESGHIIAGANPSLQINLYNQTYNAGVDRVCFSRLGILKTYPAGVIAGGVTIQVRINETFAESLADTLFCTGTGTCKSNGVGGAPIPNFPSTCSYIDNYIKTKVL